MGNNLNITIVMPCDTSRLDLLHKTLDKYKEFTIPEGIEFIIPTRTIKEINNIWGFNINIIEYKWEESTFSPVMGFNLGVKSSKYENIIITSPEVRPITNVISQFMALGRGNYIAQVFDCDEEGKHTMSLVNSHFRANPGYYFLAMYKKEDILFINGWNNEFMYGYAYDDDDFGHRFVKAGNKFEMRDEIMAEHQWHKRGSSSGNLNKDLDYNIHLYSKTINEGIIKCKNGLEQI